MLVVLKEDYAFTPELKNELRQLIRDGIGPIATPKDILHVSRLPKTRSGKVMRRIIKSIAEGKDIGDVSTIEDSASVEEVRKAIAPLLK